MKKKLSFLFVMLFSITAFAQFSAPPKIAVYVTGDLTESEKRALGAEMLSALLRSGRFTAVERSSAFVAEMERELKTQHSGAIDDAQISKLGKQFGVKYVCIVDAAAAFGSHHVSARIIDVETAEVGLMGKASGHLNSMQALETVSDSIISSMFGSSSAVSASAPVPYTNPKVTHQYHTAPQVQDFTLGQRAGTWGLNFLIPGLGSFVIMSDHVGGWIQVVGGAIFFSTALLSFSHSIEWEYVSVCVLFGNNIYNIIRSSTYKKPASKTSAINDHPQGFNFAVLPDKEGNLKTYAVYSLSF